MVMRPVMVSGCFQWNPSPGRLRVARANSRSASACPVAGGLSEFERRAVRSANPEQRPPMSDQVVGGWEVYQGSIKGNGPNDTVVNPTTIPSSLGDNG